MFILKYIYNIKNDSYVLFKITGFTVCAEHQLCCSLQWLKSCVKHNIQRTLCFAPTTLRSSRILIDSLLFYIKVKSVEDQLNKDGYHRLCLIFYITFSLICVNRLLRKNVFPKKIKLSIPEINDLKERFTNEV